MNGPLLATTYYSFLTSNSNILSFEFYTDQLIMSNQKKHLCCICI